MLVQTFSKAFVMADFYWNQAKIEKELCENKAKPEMKCKGHCQLKKELEKENKKEIPQQKQEIQLFLKADLYSLTPMLHKTVKSYGLSMNDNRLFNNSTVVFRPPTC